MKIFRIFPALILTLILSSFSFAEALPEEPQVFNPVQFQALIVEPVLNEMREHWGDGVAIPQAAHLLVGTVYKESVIGGVTYLKQVKGPALGVYQIEPETNQGMWENYLAFRPERASFMRSLACQYCEDFDKELIHNLRYATATARVKYWRAKFGDLGLAWPEQNDPDYVPKLGKIWDVVYNANPDVGTVDEFVDAFPREILEHSRSM